MRTPPVPPQVIAAVRRLAGPASFLQALCRVLAMAAAASAAVLAVVLFRDTVRQFPRGTVGSVVGTALLGVPAWWLLHASATFGDVVALPQRLQELSDSPKPFTISSREDLRAMRRGGAWNAVKTIRTTVGEVQDHLGSASSAIEVAAPPFWVWTGAAAAATVVLVVVAALGTIATLVF